MANRQSIRQVDILRSWLFDCEFQTRHSLRIIHIAVNTREMGEERIQILITINA